MERFGFGIINSKLSTKSMNVFLQSINDAEKRHKEGVSAFADTPFFMS